MDSLKNLIKKNLQYFPDFGYYIPIIEKAETNKNLHPDISIECCNSLIQGISKTIILHFLHTPLVTFLRENSSKIEDFSKKEITKAIENEPVPRQFKIATKLLLQDEISDYKIYGLIQKSLDELEQQNKAKFKVKVVFKKFSEELLKQSDVLEVLFLNAGNHLVNQIANFRNDRGDISHGRAVPKELQSDIYLSRLILEMTESLMRYILAYFYSFELEKRKSEMELSEQKTYEKNKEFNDSLDDQYRDPDTKKLLDGKVLYSQALYTLYYEDYEIALQDFLYGQKLLEEE